LLRVSGIEGGTHVFKCMSPPRVFLEDSTKCKKLLQLLILLYQ